MIAGAGALAATAALARHPAASLAKQLARAATPRVAIVGAGLAGLRCAHRLWTESPGSPIPSTVYEANPDRAGGRCWTLRDFFAGGLQTEHGGSFLNSDQTAVRQLAARLGLQEEVVGGGDLPAGEEVYLIDGRAYTYAEANGDWASVGYAAFKAAGRELHSEAGEARLDAMSVPEWLESTPIGTSSRFGKLMLANVVTENGGDPGDMSALDLIELLTGNPRSSLAPLPGDDETYHLIGGNDQLVSADGRPAPAETVRHDHVLEASAPTRPLDDAHLQGRRRSPGRDGRLCRPGPPLQHAAGRRARPLGALAGQAPCDPDDGNGQQRQDPSRSQPQALARAWAQRRHIRRMEPAGLRLG